MLQQPVAPPPYDGRNLDKEVPLSVLADALSVVIQCGTLEAKYPGGEDAYRRKLSGEFYCSDGRIARVKFFSIAEMFPFVEQLTFWGMSVESDWATPDIALIDGETGIRNACAWLDFAMHDDGYPIAWMHGEEPVPVAVPDGWKPSDSLELMRIAEAECAERLMHLAAQDGVKVYLDLATGCEFAVRQVVPEEQADEWK